MVSSNRSWIWIAVLLGGLTVVAVTLMLMRLEQESASVPPGASMPSQPVRQTPIQTSTVAPVAGTNASSPTSTHPWARTAAHTPSAPKPPSPQNAPAQPGSPPSQVNGPTHALQAEAELTTCQFDDGPVLRVVSFANRGSFDWENVRLEINPDDERGGYVCRRAYPKVSPTDAKRGYIILPNECFRRDGYPLSPEAVGEMVLAIRCDTLYGPGAALIRVRGSRL